MKFHDFLEFMEREDLNAENKDGEAAECLEASSIEALIVKGEIQEVKASFRHLKDYSKEN